MSVHHDDLVAELAYQLLTSLPRSRLASLQRRIAPLLQFDVVGTLPAEIALQIFSHLNSETLLDCARVCRRWQVLADDQSLWKSLCLVRGWEWRQPPKIHDLPRITIPSRLLDDDDEGMGEDEDQSEEVDHDPMVLDNNFSFISLSAESVTAQSSPTSRATPSRHPNRHSAPSILRSQTSSTRPTPDFKLLHRTHTRLHHRVLSSSYRLAALQTRQQSNTHPVLHGAHTNTVYCLQLYTHPLTGVQTLFTGSKDRTVREWSLESGAVTRVIDGVHESSVLSLCVTNGYIATAGSDRRVAVWLLEGNRLVGIMNDHEDSVLCVRFDDKRLVSCSKDRTIRTYHFPSLTPALVLTAHRAAVNAVSLDENVIVSGSGDRSIRVWDAVTGALLHNLENHHSRGIASIDFQYPYVLSGSSDKHLRLVDVTSLQGWSTSPEYDHRAPHHLGTITGVCHSCGAGVGASNPSVPVGRIGRTGGPAARCMHGDLVRSVALGEDLVISGSYDLSIKVWDRKTGSLVADLKGGHTGRIFCIGADCTKIVSCGEDQRICIWDFSHGIDTSFIKL